MTPGELFGGFAEQALAALPWVAGGIAAAIGLYFALLGIRKGLSWFFSIIRERGDRVPSGDHFDALSMGFDNIWNREVAAGLRADDPEEYGAAYYRHMDKFGHGDDIDRIVAHANRRYTA